jgi:hypothetical protein
MRIGSDGGRKESRVADRRSTAEADEASERVPEELLYEVHCSDEVADSEGR